MHKDEPGKTKQRKQSISFTFWKVSEASLKRQNSLNHANQKAPRTCAIALKAPVTFSQLIWHVGIERLVEPLR